MTLLVALKGTDGLVLAADSRGTFGDPRAVTAQNDSQQKAHILAPHVAVLQAGAGEIGALIVRDVRQHLHANSIDGVTPVMDVLRSMTRNHYNDWFPTVPPIQAPQPAALGQAPVRPDLAYIVAGFEIAGSDGVDPKLFQLQAGMDFSPMLHDYGFVVVGVPQYALYLLNRLYEPDRSVQELVSLAVYVITETASQDGKVGGPVKVITITPTDGCLSLDPTAVEDILTGNEARSRVLRDSFYQRST